MKSMLLHEAHHAASTASNPFHPPGTDLIRVGCRRWFLQTGVAGLAGMSLADCLRRRAAANSMHRTGDRKAVILFWLSGGPSHIDTWDPKPDAPSEIRGPYATIQTAVPGVRVCEHLPLQARMMDKLTLIRSADCSASNHTPITMQAGNALARRTNDGNDGGGYPSMGSVAARFRGPNDPTLPAFIGLADSWTSDVWGAGHMGAEYEPVKGTELAGRMTLPTGVTIEDLRDRAGLRRQLDRLERSLDARETMAHSDHYARLAHEMVTSGKVRQAFEIDREPDRMHDDYGRTSIGQKALLARRLVEAGATFVLVSGAWGYFDHHGDNVRWGGIVKGLTPLLPPIDRVIHALVQDLEARGLLDSTLVMMMGEFGRGPVINKDAGRDHWTNVMSMLVAGGGLPSGQVIGSTDRRGYGITQRPVTPSDLAATVFRHLGIDLGSHWTNRQGRPIPIVTEGGRPLPELS